MNSATATIASTYAGYANAAPQPRDTPELQEQSDRLSRASDHFGNALNSLRDRVQAIVRPMPPKPPGSDEKLRTIDQAMSPLGEGLRATAMRIEQMTYELNELTDSLAV